MSAPTRPVFSDGAILGAADLTALAALDRDRDARATRHLHTPGVATGLVLHGEARPPVGGKAFVEVTVQPGFAIDGTGRELVVGTALPVSADQFRAENPSPAPTSWYPVSIHGRDAPLTGADGLMGCQSGGGPTRISEEIDVEFGRPGDGAVAQVSPAPDAGAGDGSWTVLVGFVQFDPSINRFTAVSDTADGVRVPTAGARAGLVAGQTGRVEVRPRAVADAGVPAVVVDAALGGTLVFGLHDGSGAVSPLMTVDGSGNLEVTGTLKGVQTSGTVLVVAGAASDGTVLPLPAGVTPAAVESGAVQVSVLVTPRFPAPNGSAVRFIPAECRVDADRRVTCWGTTFTPGVVGGAASVPGSCDYLVLVSVPEKGTA